MTKIEQIETAISKLANNDFSFYFFALDTKGNPTGGIANIYEHVKVLNSLGIKAYILHEKNDYHGVIDWLGPDYSSLPHVSIESNLNISPSDFIVIPEIFSNVMEQVSKFPCKKIVFSQNYQYVLELLNIGSRWTDYGFYDFITTSDKQAQYLHSIFPNMQSHIVPVSIPSYFKPTKGMKKPIIAIMSREQGSALRLAKEFALKYPIFRWIGFNELRGLNKKAFAQVLSESCLAVWIDDVASFGTFPLECFESDTPIVGKIPNMIPEWMEEKSEDGTITLKNNGLWTNSLLNITDLIATYLKHWLEDQVPAELITNMETSKGQYTEEKQVEVIKSVYTNIISNRKLEFEKFLEDNLTNTTK